MLYVPPRRLVKGLVESGFTVERLAAMTGASVRTLYRIMAGEQDVKMSLYCAIYALWEKLVEEEKHGND